MNGNETQDDRYVECDECKNNVDCYKNSIHIVYKGECINPAEKKTLFTRCFQYMEEYFKNNGYNCDMEAKSTGSISPAEEKTLCTWCFQDMEEYFKNNGYTCDDWDIEDESDDN
jgi:hypothetical protein